MTLAINQAKRSLLRGRIAADKQATRPPWSLQEAGFISACTRCGDCIKSCETQILIKGVGGFPEVNFSRGECTFCQQCLNSCQTGALSDQTNPPWQLLATIGNNCLAQQKVVCRSCADSCESRAITFKLQAGSISSPDISTELCSGCGACLSVCPTQTIQIAPAEYKRA